MKADILVESKKLLVVADFNLHDELDEERLCTGKIYL